MRIVSSILALFLASTLAQPSTAQLSDVANTGCGDGIASGDPIYPVAAQAPTLGNLTFALQHVCPVGSNAAFFILGSCRTSPIDWDLLNPCFGAWVSAPASCGRAYDVLSLLRGGFTRQGGKVTLDFAIPNEPALVTLTQSMPLCFQFVCVNLGAPNPCTGVSRGLQLIVQ